MSSTSIYAHIPYFYIIEHTPTGKKYGGAKWEDGCNPATFMTEGGYTTSSTIVNDLIKADGLDAFKTVLILTEFGYGMSSYEYETVFLQTNDIANDDNWLNAHNNSDYFNISYGSEEFKKLMLDKYGVENIMELESTKLKIRDTWIENYGVNHPMKSSIIVDKMLNTVHEKYGMHFSALPHTKNKKITTALKNYGVEHPMKNQSVVDKQKATTLSIYGKDHYMKTPEGQAARRSTCIERYGVHNPMQNPDIAGKAKLTTLALYGAEFYTQTEQSRENSRNLNTGLEAWNNGDKCIKVPKGTILPQEYSKGFLPRKRKYNKSKCITNGIDTKYIPIDEMPPQGWHFGRTRK